MKEIYSNRIFNYIVLLISVLGTIDTYISSKSEIDSLNIALLNIVLIVLPGLSALSFFVKRLNTEIYSRLFIVGSIIMLPLSIYYTFLSDFILYSFSRTYLISNPIILANLLIGIILFYYSLKFSKLAKVQRESEYGAIIMILGIFLLLLTISKSLDQEPIKVVQYIIGLLLSAGITFIGNRLRLKKLRLKTVVITTILITLIIVEVT